LSFPDAPRLSDSIASKLVEGGVPANLQILQFNSVTNLWEFVAAGGGGASVVNWGGGHHQDNSSQVAVFLPVNTGRNNITTLESFTDVRIYDAMTVTDIAVNINVNSKATDSDFALRDDGVDVVGAVITITGGTTGFFENIGFSTAIADNSVVSYRETGTASGNLRVLTAMTRLTT